MYKQPEPSPIEESFWAAAKDAIPKLEREVWIGRYRVDFLVRHKKVVIELYGYEWHNSKEKLTQDAERERALQRQGYRVIRFTGSEIYKNTSKCVQDVLDILRTLPDTEPREEPQSPQPCVPLRKNQFKPRSLFGLKRWQLGVLGGLFILDTGFLIAVVVMLSRLG